MPAFAPILGDSPTVLVLGSMPGRQSLAMNQYYANPRNSFWWIMSQIAGFSLDSDYASRADQLKRHGFCVWDVLHDCERQGSLDSSIVRSSELVNDFETFFRNNRCVDRVIFNGRAAEAIFNRHLKPLKLEISRNRADFKWYLCPSTSPAHASITKQQKLDAWREALTD